MIDHKDQILGLCTREGSCFVYRVNTDAKGYGRVFFDKKNRLVHRYMWELHNGPIPHGHVIMHTCDNPSCVNIEHLRCGTQKENMQDAKRKSRVATGSKLPQAILNESQVLAIVQDLTVGQLTQRDIAKKFGVHRSIISDIKLGKTWKSIPRPWQ